ncbi:hypothetical protein N7465_011876 [Penicillium sp. CMV-2018d]|nr:hypothetical protein N7465_011876 [Penicillium sp. CMV-2018d]
MIFFFDIFLGGRRVIPFALIFRIGPVIVILIVVAVVESVFVTPIVIDISYSAVVSVDLHSSLCNWRRCEALATRHGSSA